MVLPEWGGRGDAVAGSDGMVMECCDGVLSKSALMFIH